jgi:hypothetical protein
VKTSERYGNGTLLTRFTPTTAVQTKKTYVYVCQVVVAAAAAAVVVVVVVVVIAVAAAEIIAALLVVKVI